MQHYTDLIRNNKEWELAGIYADEGITGTQVAKREDFQRLIGDCVSGGIDMIITKSISRFARNTLDTLKYVRLLKEKNVAVKFEEENINTLTMDGELLLVILSSVAQQEVENISANVKKGLKMKMQRGELVGFQGCLGYDYDTETKSISINEKEAEIVRYIFSRYIEGAGGSVISRELRSLGYKTKRGGISWPESTIIGIIKNEKYKGDLLMGKTFTVDPITKRRLENMGEEDKFYISGHHEPIISGETFEKAQVLLRRRGQPRIINGSGKREKFSRKYSFSCMIKCGFCGGTYTRRNWHNGTTHSKRIWQCVTATKGGRKFCPDSKGIEESPIEKAFIESYQLLCSDNKTVVDEFLTRVEQSLSDVNVIKQIDKLKHEISALESKKAKLVDMRLEEIIEKSDYELKYQDISAKIELTKKQLDELQKTDAVRLNVKNRLAEFKKAIDENRVLSEFDRAVFESVVDHVLIGGYDEEGNKDPEMISFVYKTGFENSFNGGKFRTPRKVRVVPAKDGSGEPCSLAVTDTERLCSIPSLDARGDIGSAFPQKTRRTYQSQR